MAAPQHSSRPPLPPRVVHRVAFGGVAPGDDAGASGVAGGAAHMRAAGARHTGAAAGGGGSDGPRIADLCDEDKAKISRLIQQLVRVGEEHERSKAALAEAVARNKQEVRALPRRAPVWVSL